MLVGRYIFPVAMGVLLTVSGAHAQKVIYFDGTSVPESDIIPDQYICLFQDQSVDGRSIQYVAPQLAGPYEGRVELVYSHAVKGFSVHMPGEGYARMMQNLPGRISCEPDKLAHIAQGVNGPGKGGGGKPGGDPPPAPPQTVDWGVKRVAGYDDITVATLGNPGVGKTAWVIDSGVDLDHPDLSLEGASTVDAGRSRCFLRVCSSPDDENGHGTHVAGIIGAVNNTIGTVGVAPGAAIVSVRVLDKRGSGPDSGVIAGIDYVFDRGNAGDVANLSLISGKSDAMNLAVQKLGAKGVHVVSAAGNSNMDASLFSPASAEGSKVYTVSATSDASDIRATYSNYGNAGMSGAPIDYAEPGSSILSLNKDGGFTTKTGTSMSAPHLSGILLLGTVQDGGLIKGDVDGYAEHVGVR